MHHDLVQGDDEMDLVAAVRAYATCHYNEGGWDILVECYDDGDIVKLIGDAKTLEEALPRVADEIGAVADYRADIKAEAGEVESCEDLLEEMLGEDGAREMRAFEAEEEKLTAEMKAKGMTEDEILQALFERQFDEADAGFWR